MPKNTNLFLIMLIFASVFIAIIHNLFVEVNTLQQRVDVLTENVSALMTNVTVLRHVLNSVISENRMLNEELQRKEETVRRLNDDVNSLMKEISEYRKYGKIRTTVSLSEVVNFLLKDKTNFYSYDDPDFVCVDYSHLLIRHAMQHGIFMCEVSVWLESRDGKVFGHSLVEVNTSDGLYFIEPQDDTLIPGYEFHVGKDYCSLVDWNCNWKIIKISSCFRREVLSQP